MTNKRVRFGVAIAIVGATLALGRPASADGDDSKKCDCVSWWGHNGNWQFVGDIPMQLCVKTDCWLPLEN